MTQLILMSQGVVTGMEIMEIYLAAPWRGLVDCSGEKHSGPMQATRYSMNRVSL